MGGWTGDEPATAVHGLSFLIQTMSSTAPELAAPLARGEGSFRTAAEQQQPRA